MKRTITVTVLAAALAGGLTAPATAESPGWAHAGPASAPVGQVTADLWMLEDNYSPRGKCEEKGRHYVNLWEASNGARGFKDYYCTLASAAENEWWLFVLG